MLTNAKINLNGKRPYIAYTNELGKREQKNISLKCKPEHYLEWANKFLSELGYVPQEIEKKNANEHIKALQTCYSSEWRVSSKKVFQTAVNRYEKYLQEKGLTEITTKAQAHEFKAHLLENVCGTTAWGYLNKIKILFNKALELELLKTNPFEGITARKTEPKKHQLYSKTDADKILEHAKQNDKELYAAIILIGAYAIRPGEIAKLRREDINFEEGYIRLRAEVSKTRKEFIVATVGEDLNLLKQLIERGNKTIFSGARNIGYKMRKVLKELNLDGRGYTLYGFKHYGASSLYEQTNNPELIRGLCRHTNIAVTQTYIREKLTHDHNTIIRAPIA